MGEISAMGFIDPENMPQPHSENVGMGRTTCRCGGVTVSFRGVGATSALAQCPTCNEWSEALIEQPDSADHEGADRG